jgi:SbsC C-terminal domain
MSKKAFKIASAAAVAASAFVAVNPAQAATAAEAEVLVKKAESLGGSLKWAVSLEGSWDGFNYPNMKLFNDTKAAHTKAVAAVSTLSGSQKTALEARLNDNVKKYVDRAVTLIDAVSAGMKIAEKQEALETKLDAEEIDSATVTAYHELAKEIRKQEVLLSRVYGQSSRAEIRENYQHTAEAVLEDALYPVSVQIELDRLDAAITAKNEAEATKRYDNVTAWLPLVTNATMKADLTAKFNAKKSAYEAIKTPKVSSVTAINSTQLVVVFNKEVDKADLSTADFSLETKGAPTSAVLADDNKTVTLTFSSVEVTDKALTVEPVKTKADAKVSTERYVSKFTYSDTLAPSIKDVDYTYSTDGKTATAKLTFSEPISTYGTVSVNGVAVTPSTSDSTSVTIANLTVGSTYKVDVVGAKDVKGNIANPIVQNLTIPAQTKDEVKPTASLSVSGNQVTLLFSEEVGTFGTVTINGTNYASNFVQDSNDKKKYVLDAQTAGALSGVDFANVTVVADGFKDKAGNAGDKVTVTGTLTADKAAPGFVSATHSKDNNKILLTFNDVVKKGDLSGSSELTLKVKDGVYQTSSTLDLTDSNVAYGYDLDGKDGIKGSEWNIVAVNYTLNAKSTYTFDVVGKIVADSYGNTVADKLAFTLYVPEITPGTTDPQAIVEASIPTAATGNVITVDYNNLMGDSALVASNYKLGGTVLPSTATLKFINTRDIVEITLPEGFVSVNGTYVLEVTGVTDKDGNTLKGGKASSSIFVKENIAPTASKVSVVNSKTLTVDFSENVVDATATGVIVKVNGSEVTLTSAQASGGKLTIGTTKDFALTDSITVEFKSTNLADANGNEVKNGVISK